MAVLALNINSSQARAELSRLNSSLSVFTREAVADTRRVANSVDIIGTASRGVTSDVGRTNSAFSSLEREGVSSSNRVSRAVDSIGDEAVDSSRKVSILKKSLAGVGSSVSSLSGVATVFGALATAGTVAAAKIGSGFEYQMASVGAIMRATEGEIISLTEAAERMGATTEWSATQSGKALEYLGMAGFSVNQAVSALPGILNVATAGGLDLATAADIVTDSLTALGLGVEDLGMFNDVLVGTITRSNTNIEQMGEAMKYVAPVADALGYNVQELSAFLGVLADSGVKASSAGTHLRQAMLKNAKAAKVLGTASDDLIGTLKAARDAQWGIAEITQHYGLIASASVQIIQNNIEKYEKLEDTLYGVNGETKTLAETKLNTVDGQFKILQSTIEGVGISSYNTFKVQLSEGLREATSLVQENKSEVEFLFSTIISGSVAAIGAIGNITRSVKTLLLSFQSESVSFSDLIFADADEVKSIYADYESGALSVTDSIIKKQKEIAGIQEGITGDSAAWSVGDSSGGAERINQLEQEIASLQELGKEIKSSTDIRATETENAASREIAANQKVFDEAKKLRQQEKDEKDRIATETNQLAQAASWSAPKTEEKGWTGFEQDADKQLAISERLTRETKKLTLSSKDYKLWALDEEIKALEETAGKDKVIQDQIALYKKQKTASISEPRATSVSRGTSSSVMKSQREQFQLSQQLSNKTQELTLSDKDYKLWALDQELAKMRKVAGESVYLQEQISAYGAVKEEDIKLSFLPSQDDIENAMVSAYSQVEEISSQMYETLSSMYERDRDEFIELTGDKASAYAIYTGQIEELNDRAGVSSKTLGDSLTEGWSSWVGGMSLDISSLADDAEGYFWDIWASFNQMAADMILQLLVIKPLMASITGGTGGGLFSGVGSLLGFAQGGVPGGSGISAHRNQIVSQPTFFALAQGAAVMGEAGSEAVMPLTRDSKGNLAVSSTGDKKQNAQPQDIRIINSIDPATMIEYMGSQEGTKVIMNVVSRNKGLI